MKQLLFDYNEKIINGDINPLQAYIKLKELENILKDIIKGVQPDAIDEASKYGKGEHEEYGAKFQVKNGRSIWSYKGVSEWVKIDADKKALEERLKNLAKAGMDIANAETGEELELPVVTYSADSLTVKIAK